VILNLLKIYQSIGKGTFIFLTTSPFDQYFRQQLLPAT